MRSGGSVLKALSAAEGALPGEREHEAALRIPIPGVGAPTRRRCSCGAGAPSSRRQGYLFRGAEEGALPGERECKAAWRIPGEVLMRSRGSVLKAPQRRRGGIPPRA